MNEDQSGQVFAISSWADGLLGTWDLRISFWYAEYRKWIIKTDEGYRERLRSLVAFFGFSYCWRSPELRILWTKGWTSLNVAVRRTRLPFGFFLAFGSNVHDGEISSLRLHLPVGDGFLHAQPLGLYAWFGQTCGSYLEFPPKSLQLHR